MATWQDGPEYAPTARPAAFVTPAAEPLSQAEAEPPAPPPPVDRQPVFAPPVAELPELAALVPSAAPGRNPHLPFEVSLASVTAGGSWAAGPGPDQPRPPDQPFHSAGPPVTGHLPPHPPVLPNAQVNPPPLAGPQWTPPPPPAMPGTPVPVTIAQIWRAATPGVLIPLLLGAAFVSLSIFMLSISFALSARIAYRRELIRRSYLIAFGAAGLVGLLALLVEGSDSSLLFTALSGATQFACLVLPVVIAFIVGAALRAGERPDRLG